MERVRLNVCREIVDKRLGEAGAAILSFNVRPPTEAGTGFLGATNLLHILVEARGATKELIFFIKTLTENEFHRRCIVVSRVFYKEAEFFREICPKMSKYFTYKLVPDCYYVGGEELLVLENLAALGYRNVSDSSGLFDLAHCRTALARLASFHAASFLLERDAKSTIVQMYPHLSCEAISWFKIEKGHPGYEHSQTGVRALGVVLERYFPDVGVELRRRVEALLASNPSLLLPSKKYRNALVHADLWCNNLMFKYNEQSKVDDCIIIDFQLFGYSPPSVDVLSFIFIVTDHQFRRKHLTELADYYYSELCASLRHFGENPDHYLTLKEFHASFEEAIPVAITSTAITQHFVSLPENELATIFGDPTATKNFMEQDRSPIVLRAMENNAVYRTRVISALTDCVNYVEGNSLY